jgi:Domain of unknown function (DUF5063)
MPIREEVVRYCALIEGASSYGRGELVASLSTSLVDLYRAGLELTGGPPPQLMEPRAHPPIDESQAHFASVQAVLGDWGSYHTTPWPRGPKADVAIELPVASPLVRVWSAVKLGLVTEEHPASAALARWHWWFDFHTEWGSHALEALRALHPLLGVIGGHITNSQVP